jgi:hypothetical protein
LTPVRGAVTKTFSGVGVTPGSAICPSLEQPVRAIAVTAIEARTRATRENFMVKV